MYDDTYLVMALSLGQLRKIISIKEQIAQLDKEFAAIMGAKAAAASDPALRRGKFERATAARAAMAVAQTARSVKLNGAETMASPKKPRKVSAAARAKMATAARAMWAKVKAAGKKHL